MTVSASEVERWRAFLSTVRNRQRMFTPCGTYAEACALVVGFDLGGDGRQLDGFQRWMSTRNPDRPELAPIGLIVRELYPVGESYVPIRNLTAEQSKLAVGRLCDRLLEYLEGAAQS